MTQEELNTKWEALTEKYPDIGHRENMSEEREKSFVEDLFSFYEEEGYSDKFWTPYTDHKDHDGQKFEVIGRCTTDECDLCVLPMWNIKFSDGTTISAYPEEIIPSEIHRRL